ncbi:hypothetical protein [Nocardioides currus]|uniref:Fibronectin type-III domain-containing protein n=1 Tax=Nocardioides currus TaxID=2133958 RepID=A0A2R7YYE7_9ACTN|nr:hypothetical protein [Nocardioides currus]PUA81408.1 hypothetical protein C7S10_10380 [Nocardioides currus]
MRVVRSLVLLLLAATLPVLVPVAAHAAAEGEFINLNGDIYRIAGGAPVYLSAFGAVTDYSGSPRPVSQPEFDSLRPYPADGTITRDGDNAPTNQHYRWAGGAPIVITSWANIGGEQPAIRLDPRAVSEAGTGRWARLRQQPLDGTQIAGGLPGDPEHGTVYVVAGGAPIYISNFDAVGGARNPTVVDLVAIRNAGNGQAPYSHLRFRPPDGTVLNDGTTCYTVSGGAPIVTGPGTCGTRIDKAAVTNAGQPGKWSHLNAPPPPPPPPPAPVPVPVPAPVPPPPAPPALVRTVDVTPVTKKSKLRIDVGPDSATSDYEVYVQRWQRRKWRTLVVVMTSGPRDVKVMNLRRGRYRALLLAAPDAPQVVSRGVRLRR